MASAPLVHQPGVGFDYSPGPDVVRRLIEVWSGITLDGFLEERVFRPLHLTDTAFWVPEEKSSRLATLYDRGPNDTIVRTTGGPQDGYKTKPIYFSGARRCCSANDNDTFQEETNHEHQDMGGRSVCSLLSVIP